MTVGHLATSIALQPTRITLGAMQTVELETGPRPDAAVIWLHGLGAGGPDFEPIGAHGRPRGGAPTAGPGRRRTRLRADRARAAPAERLAAALRLSPRAGPAGDPQP